ncbi:MAG: hypothetical protein RJA22_182 [Verrucomicrobiota bacterium]
MTMTKRHSCLRRAAATLMVLGWAAALSAAERSVRLLDATLNRGQTNCLSIVLESTGNENALGVSLCFDPNLLRFVSVRPRPAGTTLTLNVNSNQAGLGRLGLAASLAFGETFPAGSHLIAELCFRTPGGEGITTTPVLLCDQPVTREVSDGDANPLPARYSAGTITLAGECRYALESGTAAFSAAGGLGAGAVSASTGCPWTATTAEPWITVETPYGTQGDGPFTYLVAPNPSTLARTGVVWVAGQSHLITQQGIFCDFRLGANLRVFGPEGGGAELAVLGNTECHWTATSLTPWIILTAGMTGRGDGTVSYEVSPQTGFVTRTGLVMVAGQTFTVVQQPAPCTFSLSPTTRVHTAASEFNIVDVSGPAGCDWTIDNLNDWILIKLTTNGTGDGIARYTVLANDRPVARSGIITVAGLPFTVQQLAAPCGMSLLSTGRLVSATGATGMVQFATLDECPWTALNTNAWIEMAAVTNGVGGGTLGWQIGPNFSSSERTGHITVNGRPYRITQYPTLCSSSISPTSRSIGSGTATGNVSVSISSACSNVAWRIYNPNPWITVYRGLEGMRDASIPYSVLPFLDYGTRTGHLHIADRRLTIVQSGIPCTYSISPSSRSHSYLAETNTITFTVSGQCSWRATPNASWIVLLSATQGNGNATLRYATTLNTGSARSGTISAQGQTFTVSQGAATPVSITSQPVAQNAALGGTARFTVTAAGTAPLSYQWRFNGTNLSDSIRIAGATTATLTLSDVQTNQAGNYSVVVGNLRGSVTSANAALRVNSPPRLEPIPNRSAVRGAVISFQARATDPDSPAQSISYSLAPGAPAGATVDPASGQFSWTAAAASVPASFAVTLRASDNGNPALTDTRTFTLTVIPGYLTNLTLVPFGAPWRYRDTGENLGTAWTAPDYNDQAWATGPAPLGYGNGNEATVVSYGTSTSSRHITTYFRHAFQVEDPTVFTTLALQIRRDDGVVFHLNGQELFRENMPTGTINHETLALSGIGSDEEGITVVSPPLPPGRLVAGRNVLAVEVHNRAADNGDLAIDALFSGTQTVAAPLILVQPLSMAVVEHAPAALRVTASSALPRTHQWFFNGTAMAGHTNDSLQWPEASLGLAGDYFVVVANPLGAVTSQVATVTVMPAPNRPPVIAPVAARVALRGRPLEIQLFAFDPDQPPQTLAYHLEPGAPVGAALNPSTGLFTWTPLENAPSTNRIHVRVTDDGIPPQSTLLAFDAILVRPPRLLGVALGAGRQPVLTWESEPGARYEVEESTELFGDWTVVPGAVTASGQTAALQIPRAAQGQRFYRVRRLD